MRKNADRERLPAQGRMVANHHRETQSAKIGGTIDGMGDYLLG
jgi:hypothetical protein